MSDIRNAIEKYKEFYYFLSGHKFTISEYKEIKSGLQFFVQKTGWSGIIKIYEYEDIGVKIDFSQLDKSGNALLIRKFSEIKKVIPKKIKAPAADRSITLPAIGIDESGKADYFGSLVVASVYVDKKAATQLAIIGVKDSKTLTDTKIEGIAREIRRICQDKFAIVELSAAEYNQLYTKLESEKKSLNDLLTQVRTQAIEDLLLKAKCITVVVDKLVDRDALIAGLENENRVLDVIQDRQNQQHLAICASSILAKDRFLQSLRQLGKQHQVSLPKGSVKAVITVAKQLVDKNGVEILSDVAKVHFKTTKEVLSSNLG